MPVHRKGQGKEWWLPGHNILAGTHIPVFLLDTFAKNEKTDLTPKERRVLKTILAEMVNAYKSSRDRDEQEETNRGPANDRERQTSARIRQGQGKSRL